MKNLIKKLSAIAISAIMAVTTLPMTVFAETEGAPNPEELTYLEPVSDYIVDDIIEEYQTSELLEEEDIEVSDEDAAEYEKKWLAEKEMHADDVIADAATSSKYNTGADFYYNQLKNDAEKTFFNDCVAALEEFYWSNEEPVANADGTQYSFGLVYYDKTQIDSNRAYWIVRMVIDSYRKYFFLKLGAYGNSSQGTKWFMVYDEFSTRAEINRYRDSIEKLTDEWITGAAAFNEDIDKEMYIISKLVDHIVYGKLPRLDKNGQEQYDENGELITKKNHQHIAGALVDRVCICAGYASATSYLMNAAGIDCFSVGSTYEGSHAFNFIKLYGNWYMLDVTWLDPNKKDGQKDSENLWETEYNLNKSYNTFRYYGKAEPNLSHTVDEYKDWQISFPECTRDVVTDETRTVKVTFSGDGISIPTQSLTWGEKAVKPDSPTKSGYRFGGWYKDSSYTKLFDFDDYIYGDTTLYARMTKIQNSDEGMTIEEGVLTGYTGDAKTFVVPADVHTIENKDGGFYNTYNNEKYEVAAGNNWFTAVDGVLFSKDMKTLVAYPKNKAGTSYSVPASVKTIRKPAFSGNRNLETVSLPEGVETIEHWAFLGSKLKYINIPESVTYIGVQAYSCPNLADPIVVPENVKTIYGYAFANVKSKSITIYGQITTLYTKLFNNCTELEYVVLPATLTTMGEDVFLGCTVLKDIYFMGTKEQWDEIDKTKAALPDGVTMHYGEKTPLIKYTVKFVGADIDDQTVEAGSLAVKPADPVKSGYRFDGWFADEGYTTAFDFTKPITSDTTVYAKFTEIQPDPSDFIIENGKLTGYNGKGGDITLPANVTDVDTMIFELHKGITNIYVASGNTTYTSVDGVLFSKDKKTLVVYPRANARKSYAVPTGTTKINIRAFSYADNLTQVTLPDSVTDLDYYLFFGCKITSMVIPKNVTELPVQLFYNCGSLKTVELPTGLKTIGNNAFSGCSSLTDVYFMGTKAQWEAISKSNAAIPNQCTIHFAAVDPTPAGNVVVTYGGAEHIFNDLTTLGKDKAFKGTKGAVVITINTDLTAVQTFAIPSKATSITIKSGSDKQYSVKLKAATLTASGNLTLENVILDSGKKKTAITAKKTLTATNCTLGNVKVTGHADIANCTIDGTLTLSEKNNNTTLNEVTLNGNLTCSGGLTLVGCTITGDIKVTGILTMSSDSKITGKLNIGGIAIV